MIPHIDIMPKGSSYRTHMSWEMVDQYRIYGHDNPLENTIKRFKHVGFIGNVFTC